MAERIAQAAGNRLQQPVADRVAERIVDRLEVVDVDAMDREPRAVALQPRQHFVHALVQQQPVGQLGQRVVVRHEVDARLGPLALGDVDRRHQDRRYALIGQPAREDGDVDDAAVGLAMPPGAARLPVLRRVGDVGNVIALGAVVYAGEGSGGERRAVVAVMCDRGIVHRQDALPVDGADEHRQRVGIEQQAERGLALLHFGDVDAQADGSTVAGTALLDQNHAPVG